MGYQPVCKSEDYDLTMPPLGGSGAVPASRIPLSVDGAGHCINCGAPSSGNCEYCGTGVTPKRAIRKTSMRHDRHDPAPTTSPKLVMQ